MKRRADTKEETRVTRQKSSPSKIGVALDESAVYQDSAYSIEAYDATDVEGKYPCQVMVESHPVLLYDEPQSKYYIAVESTAHVTNRKWSGSVFLIELSKPSTYVLNEWRFCVSESATNQLFRFRVRKVNRRVAWQSILPSLSIDIVENIIARYVHEKDLFEMWSFHSNGEEDLKWLLAERQQTAITQIIPAFETSLLHCPFFEAPTIKSLMSDLIRKGYRDLVELNTLDSNGQLIPTHPDDFETHPAFYGDPKRINENGQLYIAFVKQIATVDGTILPSEYKPDELMVVPGGRYTVRFRGFVDDKVKLFKLDAIGVRWTKELGRLEAVVSV